MVDREGGAAIRAAIDAARLRAVRRGAGVGGGGRAADGGEAEPVRAGAVGSVGAEGETGAEGADQCEAELKRSAHYRTPLLPLSTPETAAVAAAVGVGVGVEAGAGAAAAAATAAATAVTAAGAAAARRDARAASTSAFAACTQPVRFYWPGHPEGYVPRVGRWPPRAVQRAAPSRPSRPPWRPRAAAALLRGGWRAVERWAGPRARS